MENYKILLIDDDPFISDMYLVKFKERGFQVEVAQDGKTGLARLKEYKPHIVLLDVIMPIMDGFEILKKIKNDSSFAGTKVVLLTNLGQKEDIEKGLELGADDYIVKAHYTPTEVVDKIEKMVKGET